MVLYFPNIRLPKQCNVIKLFHMSDLKASYAGELLTLFQDVLGGLEFLDNEKSQKLRPEILQRLASLVQTDEERAASLNLPRGCRIREGAKIIDLAKLTIGEYCWIGENAILDASGGLTIGSHTSIGLSVFVWTHSSHLANITFSNEPSSKLIKRQPTAIGSGCFISGPSVILPGAVIGNQCIVQPFSVVQGEVPDRSIVSGTQVSDGVLTDERIERMTFRHLGKPSD